MGDIPTNYGDLSDVYRRIGLMRVMEGLFDVNVAFAAVQPAERNVTDGASGHQALMALLSFPQATDVGKSGC